MKSKSKPKQKMRAPKTIAILHSPNKTKKDSSYNEATLAIQKKLEEIKKESKMPAAVNNNLSLFRYKV